MRRLLSIFLLVALPVFAQDKPANLQPLPAVPPPPPEMSSWDTALEPQVTIKKNDKETREEFRINGRLYMVKVTPGGGAAPYYLVDNKGDGNFSVADPVAPTTRPPMWVIHRF